MKEYVFRKNIPVKKSYDVIVAGGGVAGCAAAYSAAKNGYKTLLIERSNILGGLATLGLINLFVPMCNGRGKQIIFGLAEKWTRLSAELGYDTIPEPWKSGEPNEATTVRYTQRFSPYIFAFQLMDELVGVGADLLYDCTAVEPVMEGNICRGVVTSGKSGLEYYEAKMIIDVTGECDVIRRAGVPHVPGQNFFTYSCKQITLEGCAKAAESGNIRLAYSGIAGGGINLYGKGQPEDVPRWSGLTVDEVNDYLIRNQKIVLEKLKKTDRNSRDIATVPGMPQFRTTCRIKGEYTFTENDAYRHFDDSVCAINDFDRRDYLYEVPYRALYNKEYPNIITAGRSASAEGYGWDVIRVIPPAIITGQAAAEAACIAISDGVGLPDVDIRKLQTKLERENVMIHFPDEYVPACGGGEVAEIDGGHI